MSLKVFSLQDKIDAMARDVDQIRRAGYAPRSPEDRHCKVLKAILQDLRARQMPRSLPLGELERALAKVKESKTALGYDQGAPDSRREHRHQPMALHPAGLGKLRSGVSGMNRAFLFGVFSGLVALAIFDLTPAPIRIMFDPETDGPIRMEARSHRIDGSSSSAWTTLTIGGNVCTSVIAYAAGAQAMPVITPCPTSGGTYGLHTGTARDSAAFDARTETSQGERAETVEVRPSK